MRNPEFKKSIFYRNIVMRSSTVTKFDGGHY